MRSTSEGRPVLTSHEQGKIREDISRPAGRLDVCVPEDPRVLTLGEDEDSTNKVDEIHGHNDKPKCPQRPRMNENAHQSNGECGFTQRTSNDCKSLCNLCVKGNIMQVAVDFDILDVSS